MDTINPISSQTINKVLLRNVDSDGNANNGANHLNNSDNDIAKG